MAARSMSACALARYPDKPDPIGMSAFGTKRTCACARQMSAIGGKADIDLDIEEYPLMTHRGHSRAEINGKVGELRHSRSAGAVLNIGHGI